MLFILTLDRKGSNFANIILRRYNETVKNHEIHYEPGECFA